MNPCSYCGQSNEASAAVCASCGEPLEQAVVEGKSDRAGDFHKVSRDDPPSPPTPELASLDMRFEYDAGFARPDWAATSRFIKEQAETSDLSAAWEFAARSWLHELSKDLGGDARVYDLHPFLCLSDVDPAITEKLLRYAVSALTTIRGILKSAAWTGYYGPNVLMFFSDPEDYFAYVSFYYREGTHPQSGGIFLTRGYAHIALPFHSVGSAEHTIAHELTHNLLAHLRIPRWLNEGLAVVIERSIRRSPFLLDKDEVERHATFWNERTIHGFWSGSSFGVPGDSTQLSYDRSEILVRLLAEKGEGFIEFIKHADWRDAGQEGCRDELYKYRFGRACRWFPWAWEMEAAAKGDNGAFECAEADCAECKTANGR